MTDKLVRKHDGTFHWEGVDVLAYKQEGAAPFKDVKELVAVEGWPDTHAWMLYADALADHIAEAFARDLPRAVASGAQPGAAAAE